MKLIKINKKMKNLDDTRLHNGRREGGKEGRREGGKEGRREGGEAGRRGGGEEEYLCL